MAYFEARGIAKSYGKGQHATNVLETLDLEIDRGEFVAVVGFSGAGKTTLVSILAGLLRPDRGEVVLDGSTVKGPGPERGVVFQTYALLPWLSVFDNVHLAVDAVFASWPVARRVQQTERYIAMVGLTAARDKKPAQLSGGMRQRVALARALAVEPAVLLMDEPLSALDALTRATLQDELARIHRQSGATMVLVTNDVDEAVLLADRIVPLSAGPAATLGPSFHVELEHPRDRKAVNHEPAFKKVRGQVIEYLMASSAARKSARARPPKSRLALVPT